MNITPITTIQNNQQSPSFKALKFRLNQNSRMYLCKLCNMNEYNADQTSLFIQNINNGLKKLNNTAKVYAQAWLDNNSKTRGLTVEDVWAKDTPVDISINVKNDDSGKSFLSAIFNKEEFISEPEMPGAYTKLVSNTQDEITPDKALNFLHSLPSTLNFNRFVNLKLKEQPEYKLIENNYISEVSNKKGRSTLNEIIRDWVYYEN